MKYNISDDKLAPNLFWLVAADGFMFWCPQGFYIDGNTLTAGGYALEHQKRAEHEELKNWLAVGRFSNTKETHE